MLIKKAPKFLQEAMDKGDVIVESVRKTPGSIDLTVKNQKTDLDKLFLHIYGTDIADTPFNFEGAKLVGLTLHTGYFKYGTHIVVREAILLGTNRVKVKLHGDNTRRGDES